MERPKINEASIPKTLDRYEIKERIGAGGMGVIVKGFDTRLKRPVAIKMISDRVKDETVRKNIRERFFNEARAAGGISHPNIVQVYDFGEINDVVYIVMEYIEGETLEQLLKAKGPLNIEQLLKVSREIASGLSFAHKKGIVHRDIKPSNIIIEANTGIAKILDFGIAKFVDEEEMKLTSTGMVLGSTHYLSPEHIIGKNLDGRSDIFCLGTVLYEAATGVLPFRGSNSSTILYKIVHFDPPPPSELKKDLNKSFSTLVTNCLAKKSNDRFQKCEDVVDSIAKIEREIVSKSDASGNISAGSAQIVQQSYFVRDSQLLTALVTQKKLTAEESSPYRGKAVYDALIRDGILAEDDLAATISECLQIPWIPKGRLKSLRVSKKAFSLLSEEVLRKYSILPFFIDEQKKSVSMIIDGATDFQRSPEVLELFDKYFFQLYVGGRNVISRLISASVGMQESGDSGGGLLTDTGDVLDDGAIQDKRVLLIEPQQHYQEALVKLFQGQDHSVTLVSTVNEAMSKIKSEKFHHVWSNRDVVGDELAFENHLIKSNPSVDVRFYDNLGEELFEDSIQYERFREFFIRTLQIFLAQGTKEQRESAQEYGSLAVKIARAQTQNQKELDEVYFSALFFKWERMRKTTRKLSDVFNGIYRFRHIANCIGERFDGRGPLAIKGNSIPVGSRVLAVLSMSERVNSNLREWTEEQYEKLNEVFDTTSGKQLDPVLVSQIMDLIRPKKSGETTKKRVVIVDSDKEYSTQLQAHLRRIGADPTVYSDGITALSGIKKSKPDLIISEVILAKLDGFAFAARLRADEMLQKIPLVFLSESQRTEHSTKAIQLGAEDFISKTSEPQFIMAKVEKLLK